jgi:NAD(P)-dependent dehydrogenase (short-subunit alcohol dehydrogenase family)/predicted O-methyltransferase YrrM
MFRFSNAWTTDVVEAKTLAMFAYMLKAKRVMEIGMFTGYGALTIAEVLPEGGKMISCEIDPFLAEFSKPFFARSPHGSKVDVRLGPALETMKAYDAEKEGGGVDMIFIDADKGGYAAYYEAALTTPGLLAEGGVIVVDNTLFKGQAWLPPQPTARDRLSWNAGGVAVAAFNELVASDSRVEQVILPIRDGITIVRRKGGVDAIALPPRALTVAPAAGAPGDEASKETAAGEMTRAHKQPMVQPAPKPGAAGVEAPKDAVISGVGGKSILERMRLDGKVALVTGGGQGIGRAFSHAFCEAGAAVMVVDLDLSRAEAVAAELASKGGVAIAYQANVAEEASVAAMVAAAVERLGGLHIAVNNAGINKNSAAEDTPVAEWDATFNVNTLGVFMCCQHEARHMLKHGGGKIINTASMASLIVPHPQKQAAYNSSKSAVVKLTQSLACEWADRGVNVNCISPGIVDTPLIWDNPAMPIGRLCNVTDLQAAIVYLASEASDYMVGHNLVIEGGQSLW